MVYLPPDEASAAHRMVMKVKAADNASLVATVNVALHDRPDVPGLDQNNFAFVVYSQKTYVDHVQCHQQDGGRIVC